MLLTIAIVFGLTAIFSVINERLPGLQQTIGLMLMALLGTLLIIALDSTGVGHYFLREQQFIQGLR